MVFFNVSFLFNVQMRFQKKNTIDLYIDAVFGVKYLGCDDDDLNGANFVFCDLQKINFQRNFLTL